MVSVFESLTDVTGAVSSQACVIPDGSASGQKTIYERLLVAPSQRFVLNNRYDGMRPVDLGYAQPLQRDQVCKTCN
jgi:hypothetical protein